MLENHFHNILLAVSRKWKWKTGFTSE